MGVLAAHSGAGATTVALALSDAAAASGRLVHLVDTARSSRSGLAAAASEELGTDVTGAWRRGLRTGVTIDRRATNEALDGWPTNPGRDRSALTVVDLGLANRDGVTCPTADRTQLVVFRPTVPGVRLTEQLLDQLGRARVVIAAVGPSRWPGEVMASVGPRLRELRAAGRVVSVPTDRRLQITGPTSSPLPRSLRSAGRSLLELVDNGHPFAATPPSALTTRFVVTPEGTRR